MAKLEPIKEFPQAQKPGLLPQSARFEVGGGGRQAVSGRRPTCMPWVSWPLRPFGLGPRANRRSEPVRLGLRINLRESRAVTEIHDTENLHSGRR
jgi:hypothetical protein